MPGKRVDHPRYASRHRDRMRHRDRYNRRGKACLAPTPLRCQVTVVTSWRASFAAQIPHRYRVPQPRRPVPGWSGAIIGKTFGHRDRMRPSDRHAGGAGMPCPYTVTVSGHRRHVVARIVCRAIPHRHRITQPSPSRAPGRGDHRETVGRRGRGNACPAPTPLPRMQPGHAVAHIVCRTKPPIPRHITHRTTE